MMSFTIQTPIMKNEFERIAANQPMDLLSMKRYSYQYLEINYKNIRFL